MKVTNNIWIWDKNLLSISLKSEKMIYIKTALTVKSYRSWGEYLTDNINKVKG